MEKKWHEDADIPIVNVRAVIDGKTEKAWRVNDGQTSQWIPKSLARNNSDGTIKMPCWLARSKGFMK